MSAECDQVGCDARGRAITELAVDDDAKPRPRQRVISAHERKPAVRQLTLPDRLDDRGVALSKFRAKILSYRKPANFRGQRKIFYEGAPGRPTNVKRGYLFDDPTKDEPAQGPQGGGFKLSALPNSPG
ncbi:hypothetical protein [Bradyrhizobium sp. Tv2a-2]|uniref:hypothetical protein n=1 Tax=Bradyrhizobium sp. Tv2a-2 TaxID=113395 RepID=UPI0012EC0DB3|nr:hypothetical protein [Bradyrhizobium sp. Tv2a-2]